MGLTQVIQCSFLPSLTGAGIEFSGDYCTEDGTLKDPMILA